MSETGRCAPSFLFDDGLGILWEKSSFREFGLQPIDGFETVMAAAFDGGDKVMCTSEVGSLLAEGDGLSAVFVEVVA